MSNTLGNLIIDELEDLLEPVTLAVDDEFWRDRLILALGIDPSSGATPPLLNTLRSVIDLKRTLADLTANPSVSFDSVSRLLDSTGSLLSTIGSIGTAADSVEALRGIGTDFVQMLVTRYLAAEHPLLFRLCVLLAVAERAEEGTPTAPVVVGDEVVRFPMEIDRIHPRRLIALLRDPVAVLKAEYVNSLATVADAEAMADKLFPRVAALLTQLDIPCMYGLQDRDRSLLGDAAPFVDHALTIYFEEKAAGATADAGFMLAFSSAGRGDLGLVLCPFGALKFSKQFGKWKFDLDFTAEVEGVAYGRHGITFAASPSTTQVLGRLLATLAAPNDGPAFVFGSPTGTRLELGGAQLKIETSLSEARQSLELSADVFSSKIVIAPGDGDGFLRNILPAEGLEAKFDLGLAWSNERGLTLRGSGSLDATLPVNLSIGDVLKVPTIHLSLLASDTGLAAEVSATVGLSIGPISAVVDRVGLASALTFPEAGGNLGVADLDFRFKPPSGLGLAIDASVVVGGGYLSFDPQKEEYSGVLQLEIADRISVKAIGLLVTRMPDSASGYSLIAIISAEGFAPIQLGFGFTLTGIGGLLAINRTFAEDALRAGLKNHTLDSVMFPTDPIRNAPQILSNLNQVFPPANGHYLFGPMVRLAWGTPPLITADLGLVLEFGARLRLLILGQIVAILPKRDNDLIRLQMDTIGVIDFDQGTAALDATLYDSRLLKKFVLTGDMALRLRWEGSPTFALAIGGLHPAFNPPPNFPKLERLSLNLAAGDNPRLRCEAYFALTANTVQFGARAELYAAAAGFSIQGETGFDVLLQLDPFQFLADFYAQVQLKRGSRNLFKVRVEGALAGPRPLHIKGKATFEVLWMDVTLRIDKTLVAGEKPPQPESVDVLPRLKEALGQPDNWVARLPDSQRPMVTLRPRQGEPNEVALHPLGTLTVKQNIVPLNLEITRFGQTTPAGARRFTISSISMGGQSQPAQPVRDFFAPAQFFDLSDDEKLSRPSFESLPAGVSFGAAAFTFSTNDDDWLEVDAITFDTITVDPETNASHPSSPTEVYALSPELLGKHARFGAAGASDLRRLGTARYRTARVGHRVVKEGWSIVDTADLSVQSAPGVEAGKPVAYSEAVEALRHLQQENPARARGLKILRLSELQGATPGRA